MFVFAVARTCKQKSRRMSPSLLHLYMIIAIFVLTLKDTLSLASLASHDQPSRTNSEVDIANHF